MDNKTNGINEVRIETLGAMRVGCYRSVCQEPETEGGAMVDAWLERQTPLPQPVRHFGFDIDVSPEQAQAGLRGYEVWSTVGEGTPSSESVEVKDFPGGLYATALLVHPFDDPYGKIPQAWKALHEWVIASDQYRGGCHQWLEELIHDGEGNSLKLYYPVNPV